MSFVRLENLNDFINPSTACIKPPEKKSTGVVAKVSEINLSDCLACSGCITSAETVLVQQQNYEELFNVINENKASASKKEIVVSLSLQSLASLANKYSLSVQETSERIASFFVSLGCSRIYDINLARHLALVESYREFRERRDNKDARPIISSVCPGWVCYAEKTNGDLIIPHLSRVRSPQQIMGVLLKKTGTNDSDQSPSSIYHVTLMPCFDKKLEASRPDFKDETTGIRDVDCVLTPLELEEILNDEGVTLLDFEPRKLDILLKTGQNFDSPLTSHFGSVSGGYAENIMVAQAAEIMGTELDTTQLVYSTQRNGDFIEITLKDDLKCGDTKKLAKFAIVNGFRNIQTVVQRLKRHALKYDYIEVMACPSGCINGGAQCKIDNGLDSNITIESSKQIYNSVPKASLQVICDEENEKLYETLKLKSQTDISETLYTDFHPVPKVQNVVVNW